MTRVRPALLIFFALTAASPVAAQRYVKEAGADHFLLLKDDGTVWGFGGWAGQLGPIVENCRYVRSPQQIALPGKAIDIAAGHASSYALLENGAVYSWGADLDAEVGKKRPERTAPAPVPGLANITQIYACGSRAAAVQTDGAAWIWGKGSNSHSQLGDGTVQTRTEPVRVAALAPAISVAAGMKYSVAVLTDGTVRAWGANSSATMGNGERVSEWPKFVAPTVVAGVAGAKSVAANHGTVVVVLKDGTLRAWGHDGFGQAGIGTNGGYQPKPGKTKLTDVANVFLHNATCFAVNKSGQLYVWGFGNSRLLGVMKNNLYVPTLFSSQ